MTHAPPPPGPSDGPGAPGPVDRCVCHAVTFAELRRLAVTHRLDLGGLRARTGCCSGCGSCEPYVRLMLATGRERFPVLSARGAADAMGLPGSAPPA